MTSRYGLFLGLSALALATGVAAQTAPPAPAPAPADNAVSEVVVTARRLDAAREAISPEIGASTYSIPKTALQQIPGGENASLNQVVLQMPGVAQDSYGQLHIRGDHGDVQYRFNGVILPEGLSFFGQVLSPRIANSVELITGALPAQYGLRTAGILEIRTKSGLDNGGSVGIYGGSHGDWEPSIEYGGSKGSDSYFGSLSYSQNQLGIESPDGIGTPRHDRTSRTEGFAYFDHVIDDSSRITVFGGASAQSFQIPDIAGQQPTAGYQYQGQSQYPSDRLNQNQRETNAFAAVSYLKTTDKFTGQLSVFGRFSRLSYKPDVLGELLYNGVTQFASKEDTALGLQAEGAYKLGDKHTVRAGFIFENDRNSSRTTGFAFETNPAGMPIVDMAGNNVAATIIDNGAANAQTYSLYLQDEWQPVDAFTLNYGLRFDQLSSFRSENQLSPRVNFVWTPLRGTTVHGGYARYFTPPPFELVANQSLAKYAGTVAYPPVTRDDTPYSERANYYDLGVQQKLWRMTLGIDGYYRTSKDLLDEGQFGAPIILTPFNYAQGKIDGVEFTANYAHGPITAYANLAWSEAKGKDIISSQFNFSPEELSYIANHFIYLDHNQTWSSSFGVSYHWRDTRLAVDGLYGSGLRATPPGGAPNSASLPGYAVVNLSLQQHVRLPGAGSVDLRFDVVNLADKLYEIRNGTGVGVGQPQFGAGRGFFGGITKSF